MLHCDLRVRWKVASDLRFRAAISEPKTPSFCGISGDLAPSTRKSLAIAIVRFWRAKPEKNSTPPPGGLGPTPSSRGPPVNTLRVPVSAGCLRRCASCLRYLYGMLYVCLCLALLSLLCVCVQEWAKRRNTLLGHKMALRLSLGVCVSGAVPRAGCSSNSRCSCPLGRPGRRAAMGPATPLVHATKSFSFFLVNLVGILGMSRIEFLGCFLLVRNGDESLE